MDGSALNRLLHQSESETLDFKRDQYPFEAADKEAKSELLKDILAMANAWKSSDGYILVGVEEMTGKKADVVGVTDHLDDAKLQQFVNEKTNKPVSFGYSVVTDDGKQVGVLTVAADQARPVFLKRDFGKLRKNVVYIRRGSSTGEASPDEIAEMGAERASVAEPPSIEFEFAEPDTHTRLGTEVDLTSILLVDPPAPPPEAIHEAMKHLAKAPLIESPLTRFRINPVILDPLRTFRPSPEQVRAYRQTLALHAALGFWIRNAGSVTAEDVRVVIRGKQTDDLSLLDEHDHPKNRQQFGIPTVLRSDVRVDQHGDGWSVSVDVGKLQPKSDVWISDRWYVGARRPLQLDVEAKVFADNLPEPISVPLVIKITTTERIYYPEDFEEREDE